MEIAQIVYQVVKRSSLALHVIEWRGIDGLADAVKEASRRTAGVVGYLGEWHSHPRGHSAKPSRDFASWTSIMES